MKPREIWLHTLGKGALVLATLWNICIFPKGTHRGSLVPTAPLGTASDQKIEVISPPPNERDYSQLPSRQKAQKVHHSEGTVCMARGQWCDVSVDRKAPRPQKHFDPHSSPYRPFQNSLLSHKKHNLQKRTQFGNLEQHFAIDYFCSHSLIEEYLCTSTSPQQDRESSPSLLNKVIARCSDKIRNIRIEVHIRTLYRFKQWCTRA